ncbi:MAG: thioredoxin family protein, partial [Fimbriimonadales bacterium]
GFRKPGTTLVRLSIATTLVLVAAVSAHAQVAWQSSLAKAAQAAASQGKPLFIVFHASWCGPCKMLEENVFPKPRVQALLKRVVGVRIDVDASPQDAARYHVNSIPRLILLSSNGKSVLWDATGYREEDMFLQEFGDALGVKASSTPAPSPTNPDPPALAAVREALANGSYLQLKTRDPKAAQQGLGLLVEQLGVFQEPEFAPLAALIQKAGKDSIPALLAGMGHKHLAVRAGAYRALQSMLGNRRPRNLAFDPWASSSVRKAQLVLWQQWLQKGGGSI